LDLKNERTFIITLCQIMVLFSMESWASAAHNPTMCQCPYPLSPLATGPSTAMPKEAAGVKPNHAASYKVFKQQVPIA
jgi:hypothetical protein